MTNFLTQIVAAAIGAGLGTYVGAQLAANAMNAVEDRKFRRNTLVEFEALIHELVRLIHDDPFDADGNRRSHPVDWYATTRAVSLVRRVGDRELAQHTAEFAQLVSALESSRVRARYFELLSASQDVSMAVLSRAMDLHTEWGFSGPAGGTGPIWQRLGDRNYWIYGALLGVIAALVAVAIIEWAGWL